MIGLSYKNVLLKIIYSKEYYIYTYVLANFYSHNGYHIELRLVQV